MTTSNELRLLIVALLVSGCATTPLPPIPAGHPASPQAAEGTRDRRHVLAADAATTRTTQLLNDSAKPSAPSADHEMSSMPGLNH